MSKTSHLKTLGYNFISDGNIKIINLPEGFESLGSFGFDSRCSINLLKLPRSINKVDDLINTFILVVPKEFRAFGSTRFFTNYLFYEGELCVDDRCALPVAKYVYDKIDPNSVQFIDGSISTGISYIITNKGVIITDIDNRLANLTNIPNELYGLEVISINIFNPFDRESEYVSKKERLGDLYSYVVYKVNETKSTFDKLNSDEISGRHNSLLSVTKETPSFRGSVWVFALFLSIVFGYVFFLVATEIGWATISFLETPYPTILIALALTVALNIFVNIRNKKKHILEVNRRNELSIKYREARVKK